MQIILRNINLVWLIPNGVLVLCCKICLKSTLDQYMKDVSTLAHAWISCLVSADKTPIFSG